MITDDDPAAPSPPGCVGDRNDDTRRTPGLLTQEFGPPALPVCAVCMEEVTVQNPQGTTPTFFVNPNKTSPAVEVKLACAHAARFHPSCLRTWTLKELERGPTAKCPLCRDVYLTLASHSESASEPLGAEMNTDWMAALAQDRNDDTFDIRWNDAGSALILILAVCLFPFLHPVFSVLRAFHIVLRPCIIRYKNKWIFVLSVTANALSVTFHLFLYCLAPRVIGGASDVVILSLLFDLFCLCFHSPSSVLRRDPRYVLPTTATT